jgi:mono/diheme cytochrome c family protein
MRRLAGILIGVFALIALGSLAAALLFDLSALPEPGRVETYLATKAKHILVRRSSRNGIPLPPKDIPSSVAEGEKLFGTECAACHGLNGRTLTDAGRWMYPRAADLASPETQNYSERELFWIVKNGIRLSGMPAFGKVESDEHVWHLVNYVRSLPGRDKRDGTP